MSRIRLLKSGEISESSIHDTVIDFISRHPRLRKITIHVANEGKRSPRYGNRLKKMGMRPGAFDLFIAMGSRGYHGAWIELKSADGKVSAAQKEFRKDMDEENYFTAVCWSIDEAIKTIQWYCLG